MKRQNFTMNSHDGRTKLHGVMWIPEGEVCGIVQLVHGMIEYIERYDALACHLAEQGIFVIGHDHIGHGESVVSQEEWGFFDEDNGNKILLEDIHQIRLRAQEKYPDVPYVILGHSMGSFLTRQYLCLHGNGICAAAIIGTGHMPAEVLRLGMFVASALAMRKGWHHKSKLLKIMAFGSYNKRIKPLRTPCDWISRDEAVVDAYVAGPKTSFEFTVNGYYNLFYSMLCLTKNSYLKQMPKTVPILLAAGEEDPVGNYGKGVKKVQEELLALGVHEVECILYPEDRHEIFNELDREKVYEDVGGWILKQMQNV